MSGSGHSSETMKILREIKFLKAEARDSIAADHLDCDDDIDAGSYDDDDYYDYYDTE